MTWFLLLIHIALTPAPHVDHVEVIEMFTTEQSCMKHLKEIYQSAASDGNPVPDEVEFGCVPINKKEV
jgi:hypothetical protein